MNSQGFSVTGPAVPSLRELQVASEIAHAFLTATRPTEVYRLALEQVVPLVGAAFACVFLRDPGDDLMRVVAAHNWPVEHASFLGSMRVRIGLGPTGRAVAEDRVVEVHDVFSDPAAEDWRESAEELGFASSVSLPLSFRGQPVGALTFYFREPGELCEADRSLLRLVADQMAATAEKAHLIEDLQKANQRLRTQNVELEARYRQAEEARRLKNEFLANVSHELRTPLTAILGFAYLLREGISGELIGEQAAAVEKIEAAGGTLMGLINDLLDLTHLRLGRTTVELEECDAVALGHAALSSLNPPSPALDVRCEMPDERVLTVTDPVIAVRILQNLLSNAFKFTAQGHVTLRLSALAVAPPALSEYALDIEGGVVIWEVEDTGIGIEESDFGLIFDEFRQVDGSVTRRYGGTGMGLALSLGLAHRLGGDIVVRSTLGVGSVFTLILPVRGPAGRRAPIEIREG